jgi:putative two-component system response regulator
MSRKIRILFVDDEQPILNSMRRMFMNCGYDILTAESGEAGLEMIKNYPPVHIVVSDYRMPGMNGVEFLKTVNARWPDTVRIVLSGYADTANVIAAINDGQIFKVITKPWNDDDLKNIIIDAAEKYHTQKNKIERRSAWKLMEALPLVMLRFDNEGKIVWMNPKAAEVFGEKMLQKNLAEVLPEIEEVVSYAKDAGEASDLVLIGGRCYKADAAMLQKNGSFEGCILVLDQKVKMSEKILLIDDDVSVLHSIKRILCDLGFEVIESSNPIEALSIINDQDIAVVVADYKMPQMSGLELLSKLKTMAPDIKRIMITAYADLNIAMSAINECDVFRFISKPWNDKELIESVTDAINEYRIVKSMRHSDESMLLSLAQTVELKDPYTRGHCDRVADVALSIAEHLGLPPETKKSILHGSWLHDCGKIGVPEAILNKEGPLSPEEMDVIKKHPVWGAHVAELAMCSETVINIINYHHERYDGLGYPEGKRGKDIPLEARIVATADIFDALASDRPYRKAFTVDKTLAILEGMRNKELDPELLDIFLSTINHKG